MKMPTVTTGSLEELPRAAANGIAKSVFRASIQTDGTLEMLMYGEIVDAATQAMLEDWGYADGFISATAVKRELGQSMPYSSIRVRINSPGGDVFEGFAIHNLLKSAGKPVETCVDGVAASAASVVAMAGSTRSMGHNSMMMIHNAWSHCCGAAKDMRKMADTLDKVSASIAQTYVDRTGQPMKDVLALMDEETWLSADDCVRDGFATRIADPPDEQGAKALAERFQARMQRMRPANLGAGYGECACDCASCADGRCTDCTNADCKDANCQDCPMQSGTGNRAEAAPSNLSLYEAQAQALSLRRQGHPTEACTSRR